MKTSLTCILTLLIVVSSLAESAHALPPWKPKFKQMFVDKGPKSLQTAFANKVIGSCKVCHVNGEEKTVRNPFGKALDKLIEGKAGQRLKAAAKDGDDAKKVMQAKIDKEFLAAMDKVLKLRSPTGGGTYGERIKAGKLPFVPVPLNTLTKKEKAEGWKLLFDGKSAIGWNSWRTKKPLGLGKWIVEDGVLSLTKGGGDIYTKEAFENYELVLEWKTSGNSGILIRVDPQAGGAIYSVAPEMQVDRRMGKSKTATAALYDIYPVEGKQQIHSDGWNTVRIRMVNGEGTHWFNGHKVYSYKIGSDDWNQRIAKSKWRNKKGFGETAKGHIGLQDHGAKVSFRNMKIRVLDLVGPKNSADR
jgi:cytochrome c553